VLMHEPYVPQQQQQYAAGLARTPVRVPRQSVPSLAFIHHVQLQAVCFLDISSACTVGTKTHMHKAQRTAFPTVCQHYDYLCYDRSGVSICVPGSEFDAIRYHRETCLATHQHHHNIYVC
jgi:hypothetical protein